MRLNTLFFFLAIAVAVLAATTTFLPTAMASPHPSGTKNLHCTFNMSFSGTGASRKYWGKLQAWHDYDNPTVPYPMIQAEGKSIGVDRDGTSWRSPITLRARGTAKNNFVPAYPWFDDFGVNIHINSQQRDDTLYAVGPNNWQIDIDSEGSVWLNSDYVYVWCDDNESDWEKHSDDWERDGENDDDEKEKERKEKEKKDKDNDNHSHAVGDPAFSGFLGQQYQVHGTVDMVHNIVSAPSMQVNALFVFLEQGACPQYEGATRTNCWTHPGTYFGRVGIKTEGDERLLVQSGGAKEGFAEVSHNGKAIAAGESLVTNHLNVTRTGTHTLIVGTPLMEIAMENSDMFINLIDVNVYDVAALRRQRVHGLLGQTWRRRSGGQVSVLEGMVDDYVEASNELFGDDFVYNRFTVVSM